MNDHAGLFWVAVAAGLLFGAMAFHPFLTYPLSLRLLTKCRGLVRPAIDAAARPSVAICMCAYNEQEVIVAKMNSLLAMADAYGNATIHVYADCPSDRTAELLRPFADRVDLVISEVRTGKTYGMNLLASRSQSEVLLFTDANVEHGPDVLPLLVAPLNDPEIGCASARLIYLNKDESATAAAGAAYWEWEETIKRIESESIGLVGVDGAMFAIRRSLHRPPPPDLIDDLYLSLSVMIQNRKVVSVPEARVYERSAVASDEERIRKRRIACQAVNVHRALWPQLRRMRLLALYGYVSHRLLKWMTPLVLLAAAACFTVAAIIALGFPLVAGVFVAALAVLAVGMLLKIRLVMTLVSVFESLFGVAAGIFDSVIAGKTYTVWDPANSVRVADVRGAAA